MSNHQELTIENARIGLRIVSKSNPEWGTCTLKQDRNGWIRKRDGRGCESMLDVAEFHFWELAE